jgi:hypothetical protein
VLSSTDHQRIERLFYSLAQHRTKTQSSAATALPHDYRIAIPIAPSTSVASFQLQLNPS